MRSLFQSNSLIFKIIMVTSLIILIAISVRVWLDIRLHQNTMNRLTYEKTKIISEFIEKNVIRVMEKGKHFEIHRVLQTFGTYKGIRKINVFKPDGTIIASTNEDELNRKIKNVDFYMDHKTFVSEETVLKEDGKKELERIYYNISPVYNKPECYQCHNAKEKIVGILTVANSLKEMDEEVSRAKRDSVIVSIITIGILSSALGLLFLRFVNVPITKLISVMRKAEAGDLSVRVNLQSKDEIGRLGDSLNNMISKLDQAKSEAEEYHSELIRRADRMATIGELASGIAHEIRNPLAGIQGAIQILAEDYSKGDSRRQITDEIQKQIYKLERLVKDLLNYTKPVPSNYLPMDLNEVADNVISFFMMQSGGGGDFRIEKKFVSTLPKVMVDPSSLEQAFLNIVLNAQKAMPKGGTLTVSTLLVDHHGDDKDDGKEVQIIFEDTGMGIPKENLPKIFHPFFSTRSDGTGLGLSITRNIVEQHEGRIEVESEVGEGTRFMITLPTMKTQSP